jgi:hypothetical protein
MSCSSITQQTSTTKSPHANLTSPTLGFLGFFFTTTAEKRTIMPPSPLPTPTHTPHLQHQGPFQNHYTHTHITSPTLGFLGFSTTTVEKRTTLPPSKNTHTHTLSLSRRVRIDTHRKGGRKRICDIFEMVLLGYEVCRYHLLGMDVGAGWSSSSKP